MTVDKRSAGEWACIHGDWEKGHMSMSIPDRNSRPKEKEEIVMSEICEFRGDNYYLSNFYETPVTYEGITYQNNEAAFQAQKCLNPKDRIQFAGMNATEAKKFGRSVSLRPDWERVKTGIMRAVVHAKFSQHPELAEKLMATGSAYLAEGNTWQDRVWGIDENRNGANLLGIILMEERDALEKEREYAEEDLER